MTHESRRMKRPCDWKEVDRDWRSSSGQKLLLLSVKRRVPESLVSNRQKMLSASGQQSVTGTLLRSHRRLDDGRCRIMAWALGDEPG